MTRVAVPGLETIRERLLKIKHIETEGFTMNSY